MTKIHFSENVISPVFRSYLDDDHAVQLFTGTAGSGKSIFLYQRALILALSKNYFRMVFSRKVAETIKDSIWLGFKDIIDEWGVHEFFKINETNKDIVCVLNGNMLLSYGLDNPQKIKSIKDITHVLVDEMSEITFHDYAQLRLRLRTTKVKNTQFWGAFNPIYEFKWGREFFFADQSDNIPMGVVPSKDPSVLIVKSHFRDNPHINAEEYMAKIVELAGGDENYLKVYGKGNWGKNQRGQEYYYNFKKSKHVAPCRFIEGLPLHICWDFNTNPYVACSLWQHEMVGGRRASRCIARLTLNSIETTCRVLRDEYGHWMEAGVFYYGDASGMNTLPIDQARNFYNVIDNELRGLVTRQSRRLLTRNPLHRSLGNKTIGRKEFMNKLLLGSYGVDVVIDPSCVEVIEDLDRIKQDANGAKDKKKITVQGNTFEELGHFSDGIDGMFCWLDGSWAKR